MSATYRYFKITGGKVQAARERFLEKWKGQMAARNAAIDEFGATGGYGNYRGLSGLMFDKPPEGWRAVRGAAGAYKPPLGKAGRLLAARLQGLSLGETRAFQEEVIGKDDIFRFMVGTSCYFMGFELVGGCMILCVPVVESPLVVSKEWLPPDEHCVPLKNSEYWALKESAPKKEVDA